MLFAPPALKKQRVPNRKEAFREAQPIYGNYPEYSTRNGYAIYAYKGVVIEKRMNVYYIAKRIQIKGFPEEVIRRWKALYSSLHPERSD